MEKLEPQWIWLGKEFLNSEPVLYHDTKNLKERVKTALIRHVHRLLEETGQTKPPFSPEPIAKIRKAKILKLDLESDGMLIPTKEGFTIKINNKVPLVRQRFACAHEIGHTFLFNMRTSPPSKAYTSHKNRYWAEENTVNRIAREILMPEHIIKKHLELAQRPYIEDFKQIMNLFLVSGEVLSHRIRELNAWNVLILFFEITDEFEIKLIRTYNSSNKEFSVAKKGTHVTDRYFYNLILKAFLNEYLFRWNKIPGNDNERLIKFLTQKFGIDWVKAAKIEKIDNNKTIRFFTENNFLSLRLNNENTKLNLEIDDGRTTEFIVKTKYGELNIHIDENEVEKRENVRLEIGNFKKRCRKIGAAYIGNNPDKIVVIISV